MRTVIIVHLLLSLSILSSIAYAQEADICTRFKQGKLEPAMGGHTLGKEISLNEAIRQTREMATWYNSLVFKEIDGRWFYKNYSPKSPGHYLGFGWGGKPVVTKQILDRYFPRSYTSKLSVINTSTGNNLTPDKAKDLVAKCNQAVTSLQEYQGRLGNMKRAMNEYCVTQNNSSQPPTVSSGQNNNQQTTSSGDTQPNNPTNKVESSNNKTSTSTNNTKSKNYQRKKEQQDRQKAENERVVNKMNQSKQNSDNFDKQISGVTADMGSAMAGMQGGIGGRLGNGKEYLGSIYPITWGVSFAFIAGHPINSKKKNKKMPIGTIVYGNFSTSNQEGVDLTSYGLSFGVGVFKVCEFLPSIGLRWQEFIDIDDNIEAKKFVPTIGFMSKINNTFLNVDYIPHFNAIELGVGFHFD